MLKRSLTRLRLLRGAGILLVTLGVVHLVATPHIATLVRDSASPASARWLTPPMLLNHILVGVLLIPLGYLTTYAAPYAVSGASVIIYLAQHASWIFIASFSPRASSRCLLETRLVGGRTLFWYWREPSLPLGENPRKERAESGQRTVSFAF